MTTTTTTKTKDEDEDEDEVDDKDEDEDDDQDDEDDDDEDDDEGDDDDDDDGNGNDDDDDEPHNRRSLARPRKWATRLRTSGRPSFIRRLHSGTDDITVILDRVLALQPIYRMSIISEALSGACIFLTLHVPGVDFFRTTCVTHARVKCTRAIQYRTFSPASTSLESRQAESTYHGPRS